MPWYEVKIKASRWVEVEADDEREAFDLALDLALNETEWDWDYEIREIKKDMKTAHSFEYAQENEILCSYCSLTPTYSTPAGNSVSCEGRRCREAYTTYLESECLGCRAYTPKPWRADKRESYYYLSISSTVEQGWAIDDANYGYLSISSTVEQGRAMDDANYESGNYFKTKEEADAVLKEFLESRRKDGSNGNS